MPHKLAVLAVIIKTIASAVSAAAFVGRIIVAVALVSTS
jgi:hypothetical protein